MAEKAKKKRNSEKSNLLKKIGVIVLLLALVSLYVILPIMSTLAS